MAFRAATYRYSDLSVRWKDVLIFYGIGLLCVAPFALVAGSMWGSNAAYAATAIASCAYAAGTMLISAFAKGRSKRTASDSDKQKYRFDVAISHSGRDRELAAKIAAALRKRGLRVFYDTTALTAGFDFFEEIEAAFKNSRFIVALASKAYTEGSWSRHELEFAKAYVAESNSANLIQLPVQDLTRENLNLQISELVAAISKTFDEYTSHSAGTAEKVERWEVLFPPDLAKQFQSEFTPQQMQQIFAMCNRLAGFGHPESITDLQLAHFEPHMSGMPLEVLSGRLTTGDSISIVFILFEAVKQLLVVNLFFGNWQLSSNKALEIEIEYMEYRNFWAQNTRLSMPALISLEELRSSASST